MEGEEEEFSCYNFPLGLTPLLPSDCFPDSQLTQQEPRFPWNWTCPTANSLVQTIPELPQPQSIFHTPEIPFTSRISSSASFPVPHQQIAGMDSLLLNQLTQPQTPLNQQTVTPSCPVLAALAVHPFYVAPTIPSFDFLEKPPGFQTLPPLAFASPTPTPFSPKAPPWTTHPSLRVSEWPSLEFPKLHLPAIPPASRDLHGAVPETGRPLRNHEWDRHKDTIRHIYLAQDKSLKDLMSTMSTQHGFNATKSEYKKKLFRWRFLRNSGEDEIKRSLGVKFKRDCAGKASLFTRNGTTKIDIEKYLSKKGLTEEDLLDLDLVCNSAECLPLNVRVDTPPLLPRALSETGSQEAQQRIFMALPAILTFFKKMAEQTGPTSMFSGTTGEGSPVVRSLDAQRYSPVQTTDLISVCISRFDIWLRHPHRGPMPVIVLLLYMGQNFLPDEQLSRLLKFIATWSARNAGGSHPVSDLFAFVYDRKQHMTTPGFRSFLHEITPQILSQVKEVFGEHRSFTIGSGIRSTQMDKSMQFAPRPTSLPASLSDDQTGQSSQPVAYEGSLQDVEDLPFAQRGAANDGEWFDREWDNGTAKLESSEPSDRKIAFCVIIYLTQEYVRSSRSRIFGEENMRMHLASAVRALKTTYKEALRWGMYHNAMFLLTRI
ncbi:hypothetical protein MKZ38_004838 [Zalerion maritima]|uniref:Clr5 domain-containing protein n=1 Tax=Zalerion maritima TaxID=339359 RepID=A0AAD5WQS4_9PEZI|nr:hypothetical protein MKZ38_004838 [Zalerion maritima]